MSFEYKSIENKPLEKWGKRLGWIFGYSLFTAMAAFLTSVIRKIPFKKVLVIVFTITLILTAIGWGIKRWLK